jgi:hypothetical protein
MYDIFLLPAEGASSFLISSPNPIQFLFCIIASLFNHFYMFYSRYSRVDFAKYALILFYRTPLFNFFHQFSNFKLFVCNS